MFCIYCGAKLRDGARFCTNCGKPVKSANQQQAAVPPKPAVSPETKEKALDLAKAGVKQILAILKDQDITAPATAGEVSCRADAEQSAFMKLLKKSLMILAIFFTLCDIDTSAQGIKKVAPEDAGNKEIAVSVWQMKNPLSGLLNKTVGEDDKPAFSISVSGGTISGTPYYVNRNNESNSFLYQFAGTVSVGDKIKVNAEALESIGKDALPNRLSISVYSTSLNRKKQHLAKNNVVKNGGENSEKLKNIGCAYTVNPEDSEVLVYIDYIASSYCKYYVRIKYLLEGTQQTEAANAAIDTYASSEEDKIYDADGIDGIVSIDDDDNPNNWIIPAAVIGVGAAIGGIALRHRKKKKSSSDRKSGEKEEKTDEDEEEKATYEMRIRKDFGDTLTPGAAAQKVFARIVRIPEGGKASTDQTLTARISIMGDDYLKVSGQMMAGEYMSASVEAPQNGNIPSESVINFRLTGAGGSFTNRMHFKIAKSEIIFFQENLTLPACSDDVWRLPFVVKGASKNTVIEACESCLNAYDVKIEQGDKDGLYYAVIAEKEKSRKEAGTYEYYNLEINVVSGTQEISDSLPLYRFHMGLKFDAHGTIPCYLKQNAANGKAEAAKATAELVYFDWDPKTNEILTFFPVPKEFKISAQGETEQGYLDKLGITCKATSTTTENGRQLEIYPVKGILDAPTRFNATVTLTADCGEGRVETVTKEVLIVSQPVRQNVSVATLDEDRRIGEGLHNIQKSIWNNGEYNRLFPLYKLIDVMLDGYDRAYGYDRQQVETVKDVYKRFLNGDLAGANATARRVTLADEMAMFVDSFLQTSEEVENSMGFFTRMAVGVATLGMSEVVFTGLQVVGDMKATAQRGGDTWDAFVAGVKVVAVDYVMDRAGNYAFDKIGKVAGKYAPNQVEAAKEGVQKLQNKASEYFSGTTGKKTSKVLEKSKSVKSKASGQADDAIDDFLKNPELSDLDSKLDQVYRNGQAHGKAKVEDLQAAQWLMENNPTPENVKLYKKKVLEVQRDKFAMKQLNDLPDGNATRATFNNELDEVYKDVDAEVRESLRAKGYDMDDTPFAATSSNKSALKAGNKVTYDRDVTYKTRDGKDVPQEVAQEAYEKAFYKRTTGADAPNAKAAGEWAQMHDQTVVQQGSPVSYEDDLNPVIKDWEKKLTDAEHTGKVMTYKSTEWFEQTNQMIRRANTLEDSGLRLDMLEQALSKRQEATRQMVKQFKYVHERDVAAQARGAVSKISERMRFGMEVSSRMFATGKDALTLAQVEAVLTKNNLTLEWLSAQLGDTLTAIG